MANIKQLIEANKNSYARLRNPGSDTLDELKNYNVVKYAMDERSDHGGLAYYNPEDKTLIVAHRGSETRRDWLVTDVQIAVGVKETLADMAAMRFTDSVIEKLDRNGHDIDLIVQTGHSKGGRESQMCVKKLVETTDIECIGMTFNAARIHGKQKNKDIDYPSVNLRVTGGSAFSTDVVSSFGQQLGHNVDVTLPNVKNFIQAHKLSTFDSMIETYPELSNMDIKDVMREIKKGVQLASIEQGYSGQQQNNSPQDVKSLINHLTGTPEIRTATPGTVTKGQIVAHTQTQVVQQLGENSKFFMLHDKATLSRIPDIGTNVQIKHNKNSSLKAGVEHLAPQQFPKKMTR